MTFAPDSIKAVRAYLKGQDPDLSDTELGIVGGPSHVTQGTSYHLGRDDLIMSKNPYSARTARDLAGLSNAASALDIDDDLDELRTLSVWLVAACRRGEPDTRDIREIIYSPDGIDVWRWDRERGQNSLPIPDSDFSHRNHSHISWYRDSEFSDRVAVFRRFFEGDNDDMELTDTLQTKNNFPGRNVDNALADSVNLRDWMIGSGVAYPPEPNGYPKPGSPGDNLARLPQLLENVTATVDIAALAAALAPMIRDIVRQELDSTGLRNIQ
jgi:hypothetical protein